MYDAAGQVIRQVRYTNKLAGTYAVNVPPQIISPTATAPSAAYVRTDAKDITTRTVYDTAGRIRFTLDGENYLTEYRYDALGHTTKTIQYASTYTTLTDSSTVASITVPVTPGTDEPVEDRAYDTAGRLIQITDPEGVITRNVYDAAGRITDITVAYGTSEASTAHRVFDKAGRLIEETQAYGSADATTSRYVLDAVGNRISIIDPRGIELTETDSAWAQTTRAGMNYPALLSGLTAAQKTELLAKYTTQQTFDANGHVLTVTDPLGKTMTTAYDAFGNAVKVTDQRGYSGYFYFDKNNQATWQVDPEGYATQTEYTAFGTVKTVTRYSNKATVSLGADGKPAVGSVPTVTANAAKDQTTQILHDKRNLQTQITDAENYYETMTYDAFSNKVTYRNKLGGVYDYTYDRKGNVKTETSPTVALYINNATGNYRIVKEYLYDARGNLTKLTEAKGLPEQRTTNFQYDRLNRQTLKTGDTFVGFNAAIQQDVNLTPTEQRFYDKRGNLIEVRVTQQAGVFQRTLSYYDAVNRKIAEVSPLGLLTKWTFNDGTKPVTEQRYTDAVTLPATAGGVPPTPVNSANVREVRYEYDANNRLVKTRQVGVLVGEQPVGASAYSIVVKDITATNEYDGAGNLVKSVDGRGNATFFYYDKLGCKVAQVDSENFLTTWAYDENGNITQQTQFAYKLSITPDVNSNTVTPLYTYVTVNTNPNVVANDRITQFDYDRMGRIKVQRVLNVAAGSVSMVGALTTATNTAITQYDYNGLGNVTRQTDALGGITDIEYDVMGRKTKEKRPTHADHNWVDVTPTTDYQYNGLGLVTREIDRGIDNAVETDDRITQYVYDFGRLVQRIDAVDNNAAFNINTYYRYDGADNITRVAKPRADDDGVWSWDYQYFQYNAANQETSCKVINQLAGAPQTITNLEQRETRYNALGEITGKRLNGGGAGGLWQEVIEYDNAGRAWKSNSGDGVYKLYVYDANGNATLVLNSAGANLGSITTWAQAFALSDTTQTISQYDKRNLLTNTYQEQGSVTQFVTQAITNNYSAGSVTTGAEHQALTTIDRPAYIGGTTTSISGESIFYFQATEQGVIQSISITPPDLSSLGAGDIRIELIARTSGSSATTITKNTYPAYNPVTGNTISIPVNHAGWFDVKIYKATNSGDVLISNSTGPYRIVSDVIFGIYGLIKKPTKLAIFEAQPPSANRLVFQYRPFNDNASWHVSTVNPNVPGIFSFDASTLYSDVEYEFRYAVSSVPTLISHVCVTY